MNTQAQAVAFLAADLSSKYALVEGLTKSCALAPSGSAKSLKVTEEQVAIAEVRLGLFSTSFFLYALTPFA